MVGIHQTLRRTGMAVMVVVGLGTTAATSQPSPPRINYLQGADLGYVPPKSPDSIGAFEKKELSEVRAAQHADEARRHEAYVDAGSYDYDQLLPRFSEAAGTELSVETRPILAHMLRWLLSDAEYYAGHAKYDKDPQKGTPANFRERPYVRDPGIIPCETDYLYASNDASYPSGHATNGYAAALLIADVMLPTSLGPDRRPLIMARGIRFGDNRVVCGVHHPSDAREGRTLAEHVFAKAQSDPEFLADRLCAREEDARSVANRVGSRQDYSPDCELRFARYAREAAAMIRERHAEADPFSPQ